MSDWKGMDDILINLDDRQNNYRLLRINPESGIVSGKENVNVRCKPSDVNTERFFSPFKWLKGKSRLSLVLDTDVDLVYNKNFYLPLKDGSKPQVWLCFPSKFEDLPSSVRNNALWGGMLQMIYKVNEETLARLETLKNLNISEKEFNNTVSQSMNKSMERLQEMFRPLIMKMMEQQISRISPQQGNIPVQSPQSAPQGFAPRT